jgi:four helix bundle protein
MNEQELKNRTKQLAVRAVPLVEKLPKHTASFVFGKQVIRSSASVGATYRAACRARSDAEMIAKLGTVEEEADETQYWLEILVAADLASEADIAELHRAYDEIVAMMVASRRTLRRRIETEGNTGR